MWKIIIICITIYSKHFQVKGESHTQKKVIGFYIISICQTAKELEYPATIII